MDIKKIVAKGLFYSSLGLVVIACQNNTRDIAMPETDLLKAHLIPKPTTMTATHSGFALDQFTTIQVAPEETEFLAIGKFLSDIYFLQIYHISYHNCMI